MIEPYNRETDPETAKTRGVKLPQMSMVADAVRTVAEGSYFSLTARMSIGISLLEYCFAFPQFWIL